MSEAQVEEFSVEEDIPGVPAIDPLDWVLTVLFIVGFLLALVFFEILERLAYPLLGRVRFKRWITPALCWSLNHSLILTGARIKLPAAPSLPPGRPYIVVSNHQSMFDVPFLGWVFRRQIPQFISKIELARKIPAVSYSLRVSGDILIDRSNSSQSLKEIIKFGRRISEENTSAVIFPEGTRARDGVLKFFKPAGLATLMKTAPNAVVVPVAIDGSWKFQCHRKGPIPRGVKVEMKIGQIIDPSTGSSPDVVVEQVRARIAQLLAEIRNAS